MPERESSIRQIGGFGGGLGVGTGPGGRCDCGDCTCEPSNTASSVKVGDVTTIYHVGNPVVTRK